MNYVTEREAVEELANAIIIRAAEDYRNARKKLRRARSRKEKEAAQAVVDECLEFFNSRWFATLSNLDPEKLIQRLDTEKT